MSLLLLSLFGICIAENTININFEGIFSGLTGIGGDGVSPAPGPSTYVPQERHYYIAAVKEEWNYAPSGMNVLYNRSFTDEEKVFVERTNSTIGSVYMKALFREFTDDTYSVQADRPDYLGVLGPIIRGVVGDTLFIHFKNLADRPYSMHPHGVLYDIDSEGVPHETEGPDDAVGPGMNYTYVWRVPPRAGPGPTDPTSITWMYHSHTEAIPDSQSGLVGPIIITRADYAKQDATPSDVDGEIVTFFSIFDENLSHYLEENMASLESPPDTADEGFVESNLKHSINGRLYGNLEGLDMKKGSKVRWYLFALGSEPDLHTPHWHGQTVRRYGHTMDVVDLLPGTMTQVEIFPDNVGSWHFHCHVNDHIAAGMSTLFTVST